MIAKAAVNLRAGPGTYFAVVATAVIGTPYVVIGRTRDASWFEICCVDQQNAWVAARVVTLMGEPNQIALSRNLPPTVVMSPAVRDYLTKIVAWMLILDDIGQKKQAWHRLAINNPALFFNLTWQAQENEYLNEEEIVNAQLRLIVPPPAMQAFHATLANATRRYDVAIMYTRIALSTYDASRLKEANAQLAASNNDLQQAFELLQNTVPEPIGRPTPAGSGIGA